MLDSQRNARRSSSGHVRPIVASSFPRCGPVPTTSPPKRVGQPSRHKTMTQLMAEFNPQPVHCRQARSIPVAATEPFRSNRYSRSAGQSFFQLSSDSLRPSVRVDGSHAQPMAWSASTGRGMTHQQLSNERIHAAVLEGGRKLVTQHFRGRVDGQTGRRSNANELGPDAVFGNSADVPPQAARQSQVFLRSGALPNSDSRIPPRRVNFCSISWTENASHPPPLSEHVRRRNTGPRSRPAIYRRRTCTSSVTSGTSRSLRDFTCHPRRDLLRTLRTAVLRSRSAGRSRWHSSPGRKPVRIKLKNIGNCQSSQAVKNARSCSGVNSSMALTVSIGMRSIRRAWNGFSV